jgi:HD-GYP domain-containing protein (c-di-GMP phosphodiesterase class II)
MPEDEIASGQIPESGISLSSQMLKTRFIQIDDAQVGQILAKDAEAGFTTLLAAGTILTEERIKQLKARGVEQITITEQLPDDAAAQADLAAADQEEAVVVEPSFKQADDFELSEPVAEISEQALEIAIDSLIKTGNGHSLPQVESKMRKVPTLLGHAQAYTRVFDRTGEMPRREMTSDEAWFAKSKGDLRHDAGLAPIIPPAFAVTVHKRLRRTIANTMEGEPISRPTLDELSVLILHNLSIGEGSYFNLDDVSDREDYIPTHTLRSMLTFFSVSNGSSVCEEKREEFVKGIISHNLGLARLVSNLRGNGGLSAQGLSKLHDEYRDLYQSMRRANGIDESVLELIFLQSEHCDGSGFPYRLSGDSIPYESQCLAISNRFSHLTLSKPRMPRLSPRDASMRIIASSGTQFQPHAVHSFLEHTGVYPNGSLIKLSDQSNALVTRQNPDAMLRPTVRRVEYAADKLAISEPVDLKQNGIYVAGAMLEY